MTFDLLPRNFRFLEPNDKDPEANSLCDFGRRAHVAEAFLETWQV